MRADAIEKWLRSDGLSQDGMRLDAEIGWSPVRDSASTEERSAAIIAVARTITATEIHKSRRPGVARLERVLMRRFFERQLSGAALEAKLDLLDRGKLAEAMAPHKPIFGPKA